jgi:hypothetical protein
MAFFVLMGVAILCSCGNKETGQSPKPEAQAPAASQPAGGQSAAGQPAGGPHAFVYLKDGSKVGGTIVASSPTDMVVAGDDGIERRIPLTQIKSVEYGEAQAEQPPQPAPAPKTTNEAAPPAVTARTYELPAGSEVSVRTNETIDSGTAAAGQTFHAQVTRNVRDAKGDLVIPRGSDARIVIQSASKGGRIRGTPELALDLQSVVINGKTYSVATAAISEQGKAGVGANRRTAEYAGGGSAFGAIIGAIAGHGKGAAIGAGAGAGAGALTQVLTRGKAIKVPAESVLTFRLDKPLRITAAE